MNLLFYPNINKKPQKCGFLIKKETKSMLNRNLSLENFKTSGSL